MQVGDLITVHVTNVASFNGNKEIAAHDIEVLQSFGNNLSGLHQDLSDGIAPTEDLESELVRVVGATVAAIDFQEVTLAYGTSSDVRFMTDDSWPVCVGALLDITEAVVTEVASGTHQLESFDATADTANIDVSGCSIPAGRPVRRRDLVLNEFLADPAGQGRQDVTPGTSGDVNCDGVRDALEDEFVELVNTTADTLDLSGITISDNRRIGHTFRVNTVLQGNRAIVVFGGGDVTASACGGWPANTQVIAASSGVPFNFTNPGDSITIATQDGTLLIFHSYGPSVGGANQSFTLNPDLDDTDRSATTVGGFEAHSIADTTDAAAFSPGYHIDGTTEFGP